MRSPTLKDVASRAGVSSATVSHVINGTRFVSSKIKEKVELAISELAYTPNVMARNFKTGRRNTIGFIVPDISNIFFSSIVEEVEIELSKKGYNLIIANTKETQEREIAHIRTLSTGLVDGLMIASTLEDYHKIKSIIPYEFPVVMVDRAISNCDADQVIISSESAIRQGVSAMIANGHTKIGFIASLKRIFTTEERVSAYQDELKSHGIEPDSSLVCYTNMAAATAQLMAVNLLKAGCTAIVAGNNVITMDTVNAILQYEDYTGHKCEVLGYSYGEWYSWVPNLKTIIVPTRDAGRIAGQRILQRIEQPKIPPKEMILTSIYP